MLSSERQWRGSRPRQQKGKLVTTGIAGGFFSGLTGVGGGAVMVPLLTALLRMPQHLAHGTSLAIVVFVATASLAGYWLTENIDWGLALWVAIGGGVGAYFGAITMARLAPRLLRFVFGLFMLTVAIRMFIT